MPAKLFYRLALAEYYADCNNRIMPDQRWLLYAVLAAVSASLVNIFAKIGMEGIDSTLATAVRSVVMVVFLVGICSAEKLWGQLPTIRGRAMLMIALSGLAGATSWLFGFKALAVGGQVTQVAPIDKLSVPLAAILAFLLLRDRPSGMNWLGILLITLGAYLTTLPRNKPPKPQITDAIQTQVDPHPGDQSQNAPQPRGP